VSHAVLRPGFPVASAFEILGIPESKQLRGAPSMRDSILAHGGGRSRHCPGTEPEWSAAVCILILLLYVIDSVWIVPVWERDADYHGREE